jgi:maltooligosyltrehalose trehalohydrolase
MNRIRVWAPKPSKVELQIGKSRVPMWPFDSGWWETEDPAIGPGADYAFVLDGEGPFPDPRSPYQPAGVHGPSRFIEHGSFRWNVNAWPVRPLSAAIFYELHIGTFTPQGTFIGAIDRLDYLRELGVTHVELMPVQEFSGKWGWGYDGVDLFAPHHAYGTPDDLKRLVDAAHSRGLAIVLDVVYNHLGPAGNYLDRFGPYFTDRYSTPWGPAVNLDDSGSYEVRRFLCDNAISWLRDYRFDGLRLDAIHAIHDSSAIHFLEQLAFEIDELEAHLGRSLVLIAESDLNDPRVVTPREAGGFGIDAQWSDDFHHALHTVLTGERDGYYIDFGTLAVLAKTLKNAYAYDGRFSCYRGRNHGAPVGSLSGWRFLGYLQDHDQIGNRPTGDRSSRLISCGRLKIGAAMVLCSPFVPMLFQGEEFMASSPFQYFTQHEDPELARAVSEGRRREFASFEWNPEDVPDPQDPETFKRSKLDWTELDRPAHAAILEFHKQLIELRRRFPSLTDGNLARVDVQFDEMQQWITVRRGPIALLASLAKAAQMIRAPFAGIPLITSEGPLPPRDREWLLPPDSVLIIRENDEQSDPEDFA